MDNLRQSIMNINETGIDKLDRNILNNIYVYKDVQITDLTFNDSGLVINIITEPAFIAPNQRKNIN